VIRRALALVALIVATLSVTPAVAAEGSRVGLRPADPEQSWAVLTLAPGASERAEAVVVNSTDEPLAVRVSTADATTTGDGVFTLAGEAEPRRGVGAWITPDVVRTTLAPRESRRVGYTVRVPAGTAPGDHAGGLLVQRDGEEAAPSGDGMSVTIVERVGLRVYVTVPGTRDARVALDGVQARIDRDGGVRGMLGMPEAVDVRFRVRNTGNVGYARLHALVELRDGDRVRASAPVDLGTLLPDGERAAGARLPLGGWTTGGYTGRVRVGAVPEVHADARVTVGAGRAWAVGGIAVGGILLGTAGLRRRIRRAS
jgi:Fe-S cluster assembly iron-binding protein IscA